jgi:hypothetical protein
MKEESRLIAMVVERKAFFLCDYAEFSSFQALWEALLLFPRRRPYVLLPYQNANTQGAIPEHLQSNVNKPPP